VVRCKQNARIRIKSERVCLLKVRSCLKSSANSLCPTVPCRSRQTDRQTLVCVEADMIFERYVNMRRGIVTPSAILRRRGAVRISHPSNSQIYSYKAAPKIIANSGVQPVLSCGFITHPTLFCPCTVCILWETACPS
jgi:hypothetical protein